VVGGEEREDRGLYKSTSVSHVNVAVRGAGEGKLGHSPALRPTLAIHHVLYHPVRSFELRLPSRSCMAV
jgi:hypothetical protein